MHAYINQLAEHDVVSCLHFFCCCSSFIDSVHVALLPHHIYPSPFHLFIRSRAMFTPQRKQKNTSHLAHTKRVVGAFVSKATSCYIFCAMYTSLLCACSYVVLSIFFLLSHSFLLAIAESISNQSFFPHTPLSPSTTM